MIYPSISFYSYRHKLITETYKTATLRLPLQGYETLWGLSLLALWFKYRYAFFLCKELGQRANIPLISPETTILTQLKQNLNITRLQCSLSSQHFSHVNSDIENPKIYQQFGTGGQIHIKVLGYKVDIVCQSFTEQNFTAKPFNGLWYKFIFGFCIKCRKKNCNEYRRTRTLLYTVFKLMFKKT